MTEECVFKWFNFHLCSAQPSLPASGPAAGACCRDYSDGDGGKGKQKVRKREKGSGRERQTDTWKERESG